MIITVNDTDLYTSFKVLLNGIEMLHCVYVDTDLGFIRVQRWDVDKDSPMFDENYNLLYDELHGKIELQMTIRDLAQIESLIILNRLMK